MCTDGTPASPYLAKWSCTVEMAPLPDIAVARTAAWATATMDTWGLGGLAGYVGLIVAEFSSNAWTQGSPPVVVTLQASHHVSQLRGACHLAADRHRRPGRHVILGDRPPCGSAGSSPQLPYLGLITAAGGGDRRGDFPAGHDLPGQGCSQRGDGQFRSGG
jgi:hypothetical protein